MLQPKISVHWGTETLMNRMNRSFWNRSRSTSSFMSSLPQNTLRPNGKRNGTRTSGNSLNGRSTRLLLVVLQPLIFRIYYKLLIASYNLVLKVTFYPVCFRNTSRYGTGCWNSPAQDGGVKVKLSLIYVFAESVRLVSCPSQSTRRGVSNSASRNRSSYILLPSMNLLNCTKIGPYGECFVYPNAPAPLFTTWRYLSHPQRSMTSSMVSAARTNTARRSLHHSRFSR